MRSSLCRNTSLLTTRRRFLQQSAAGFGWLALAAITGARSIRGNERGRNPLSPKKPHFEARAKRVIFLFMEGGPSHLESFDWRPELARVGGDAKGRFLAPVFDFQPRGKSGLMISDAYPQLSKFADELCLLNGMQTNNPGHQQAVVALHTGNENFVRPSVGAWTTYGLGSEADSLPGFVTIDPIVDKGGAANYGSAFLPATFQGTRLSSGSRGVPNISNRYLSASDQRKQLDFVQATNRRLLARDEANPEIEGLIESAELAFRMQSSVPEALNLAEETPATQRLYGLDDPRTAQFGTQCLMARRLSERGVRFIQLTSSGWDHHTNMRESFDFRATATDKPIAGLIADLKQRDLLRDTLVVWGGEFGRQPNPDNNGGRGHNNQGFSMWMAGGGVKAGFRYGSTDE
ncbi:MAG: sulfatase, partial [Planctomycetales bacterium 12-60-4]